MENFVTKHLLDLKVGFHLRNLQFHKTYVIQHYVFFKYL